MFLKTVRHKDTLKQYISRNVQIADKITGLVLTRLDDFDIDMTTFDNQIDHYSNSFNAYTSLL